MRLCHTCWLSLALGPLSPTSKTLIRSKQELYPFRYTSRKNQHTIALLFVQQVSQISLFQITKNRKPKQKNITIQHREISGKIVDAELFQYTKAGTNRQFTDDDPSETSINKSGAMLGSNCGYQNAVTRLTPQANDDWVSPEALEEVVLRNLENTRPRLFLAHAHPGLILFCVACCYVWLYTVEGCDPRMPVWRSACMCVRSHSFGGDKDVIHSFLMVVWFALASRGNR